MMVDNLNDILEKFDFTDSIVTNVQWADNLVDLIIIVDYYWDIQEGRDTTRLLKLLFKECTFVNFQFSQSPPLDNNLVNTYSDFTIVLFREKIDLEFSHYNQRHIEVFTNDYSNAWLSVVCSEVFLEEVKA